MGHSVHGLYAVDLTRPKFAWHSVVLMADSYSSVMLGGTQTQFIDRVSFEETQDGHVLVRVYVRHGRIKLSPDDKRLGEKTLLTPKIAKYEIDLGLDGEGFEITPETAAAGKLFGLH
jgi:hypothetical protein